MSDKIDNKKEVPGRIPDASTEPANLTKTGEEIKPDATGYKKTKLAPSKSVIKQEVISEAITGKGSGSAPDASLGISMMRMGSYSGNEAAFVGSAADTPIRDKEARGNTRFQKKKVRVSQSIDEIPSEQVLQSFETVPSLRDDPSAEEGFNGAMVNPNVRSQKVGGAVPASGNFVRSLDQIDFDLVMYGAGQKVSLSGETVHDYPTKTYNSTTGEWQNIDSPEVLARGNYLPRTLLVKFGASGKLEKFKFEIDTLASVVEDHDTLNAANHNYKTDVNMIEVARQKIEDNAGEETSPTWSPLARAIEQPSRFLNLIHDMERDAGNHMLAAIRSAKTSLAYQLNKKVKDGINDQRSVHELFNEGLEGVASSGTQTILSPAEQFTKAQYLKGSAASLIALIDSTTKYNRLSDVLNQPRSLGMYLSNYDSYKSLFKADDKFFKVLNTMDIFSTIDREYDPLLPVYNTRAFTVVSPRDWNALYSFSKRDGNGRVLDSVSLKYGYSDKRNFYVTELEQFFLRGIADYLDEYGPKWKSLIGTDEMRIPITYSKGYVSMWPFLVVGALKHMMRARIDSFREVIAYEKNFGPMFSDLVNLESIQETAAKGYTFVDIYTPLQMGRAPKQAAIQLQMAQLFFPVKEDGDAFHYIAPWNFSEDAVEWLSSGYGYFRFYEEYCKSNYPESRNGLRFGPLDAVYNFTPQELRLSYDSMIYPIKQSFVNSGDIYVYKYDLSMSGLVVVKLDDDEFTSASYLSTPRQFGLFAIAPIGYVTPVLGAYNDYQAETLIGEPVDSRISAIAPIRGALSFSAKVYINAKTLLTTFGEDAPINTPVDMTATRAGAFTQEWFRLNVSRNKDEHSFDAGFLLSLAELFDRSKALVPGRGSHIPFVNGRITNGTQGKISDSSLRLASTFKALWSRINLLDMALSPWDVSAGPMVGLLDDGIKHDPFDLLYSFNFVGFRPSDYSETQVARLNKLSEEGYTYTKDYIVEKSPLLNQ